MKAHRRLAVRPTLPGALTPLADLALNLRWSWHTPTQQLFERLEPGVWAATGDPMAVLAGVSRERLAEVAEDGEYVAAVTGLREELAHYLAEDRWYQRSRAGVAGSGVAYFSPEYGVASSLPLYSGGLGILAGDHLKAASDLGIPLIAIGLLYRSGYFRQSLTADGWQVEQYPVIDPHSLPLTMLRHPDGSEARISLALPGGRTAQARIWIAQVGRIPLLLLDTNVVDNEPAERDITDLLYGGGQEHRLEQELLLGIGGVRALRLYCRLTGTPDPSVFHTNEGHAGFLGLERISELVVAGLSLEEALTGVRAGTVFTTHTPVPAGIDRFPAAMVAAHFGSGAELPLLPVERILALGAEPGGDGSTFNMAVMGLRLAQRANGVSALHGQVSRSMFASLWPGFDVEDVPIGHVTNGVHGPTWVAPEIVSLVRERIGPELAEESRGWERLGDISDEELWGLKRHLREGLISEARRRVAASARARGAAEAEMGWTTRVLDPDVLTIGFARRVPAYKRLTLMLRDPDRLRALLTDPERPVQIVIAGKSHPADDGGKAMIQALVRFADDDEVRSRIAFLPDYDIDLAQALFGGCDVWLNNPLRPLEACGTSGMKAALNGALNLSVRDGWWDELYDGRNGWAIPSADGIADADRRDDAEADALYELLEESVVPAFYDRDERGLPHRWLSMVRHTLSTVGPQVLAGRMLRDYLDGYYAPAAAATAAMAADGWAAARELAGWAAWLWECWPEVAVEHVEVDVPADVVAVGETCPIQAVVMLGRLRPEDVEVAAVLGRVNGDDHLADPVTVPLRPAGHTEGRWQFAGEFTAERAGPLGVTARVTPRHRLLTGPADLGLVALPAEPAASLADGEDGH